MSDTRLQAILASLLPLLPLLFPDFDEQDEAERWPWVPVPHPKVPVPQYISATFSIEGIAKTPVAREVNISLTPEVLVDAFTESWDDTPPVLQAIEDIYRDLRSYVSRVHISCDLPRVHVGAAFLVVVLVAMVAVFSFLRRKPNSSQDDSREQVQPALTLSDDTLACQLADAKVCTPGEQTQLLVPLDSGLAPSCPQAPSSPQTTIISGAAPRQLSHAPGSSDALASPPSLDDRQTSVVSRGESEIPPSTVPDVSTPSCPRARSVTEPTPPRGVSPDNTSLLHGTKSIATVEDPPVLPVVPPVSSVVLPVSPVAEPSILPQVQQTLPVENCTTPQPASCSGLPLSQEEDTLPPRSSWSLEKACEQAPFEAAGPGFLDSAGYTTPPSSPQLRPQATLQMLPRAHAIRQPHLFSPQPPIQLSPEYFRAAPSLVTEEIINGVPTDVSERTEEPDSDSGSPGTPRARWFSGIRGRLAIVDNRGLTYSTEQARPEEGVMSSPETEAPAVFPLVVPQSLLAVVAPPSLLTACDSRGLGLDMATDGEGSEDSDNPPDDDEITGAASKALVSDNDDSDPSSDGSAQYLPRSGSPSSIHTITLGSEAQEFEADSPSASMQDSVDTLESTAGPDSHVLEVAEVEEHLSSPAEWELVEVPSRGCSPEPVSLATSELHDVENEPASAPKAKPSHTTQSSSKECSAVSPVKTLPTRKVSRSASRTKGKNSVVVASAGLVGGRQFALTPEGIDIAAEQLAAENAAGDRGRRRLRKCISDKAMSKHVDRSGPPRYYKPVIAERRTRLDHVSARVDRDIVDGTRFPPLVDDVQVRRGVCEIGRSRTKTASRATNSVRLEAQPPGPSRSRSASVASASPAAQTSRAASEPPAEHVESELFARDSTIVERDERPPKLARTSYSDIVARGQSQEPRSRTQSERSIMSVSSATQDDIAATSSPVATTAFKIQASSTEELTGIDRKGKGRAVDDPIAAEHLAESAVPANSTSSHRRSSSATEFSSSSKGLIRKLSAISSHLSKRIHGSGNLSLVTTVQLRDLANHAEIKSLSGRSSVGSASLSGLSVGDAGAAPSASNPVLYSEGKLTAGGSSASLSGTAPSSAVAKELAPLRLPATASSGDSSFGILAMSQNPLHLHQGQNRTRQEAASHDLCGPISQQQDDSLKSVPLLPRRDRLPSALGHATLSFSALGDPFDESKDLIAPNQHDTAGPSSPVSGAIIRLGSSSTSFSNFGTHVRQLSAPVLLSPNKAVTIDPLSPSVSHAGFSSDEGEELLMRPDIHASGSWTFDLHGKADAGLQNRGHQALPRGLTGRRRASTNTLGAHAHVEDEVTGESVPGITRRQSARFTGGRFDGMKRNELVN